MLEIMFVAKFFSCLAKRILGYCFDSWQFWSHLIACFQNNNVMIAFNIGLPKRIVILYTSIHNFRFLHHYGKYCIETSLLHIFGILCLYSHGSLQPSDILDYHIENSRLSKHFEMEWFLLCRMHMKFVCSTSFSSVCDRDGVRWKHLDIGMHASLHSVYIKCSFLLS